MRALVLTTALACVLVAGPALAQQAPATPPSPPISDAPMTTATPAPAQAAPPAADPAQIPQAIDPLGDLIAQSGQNTDEDAAEAAGKPEPKHRAVILPIPAPEDTAVPQGGYMTAAQVYEARVKGSIAAAQHLQGPLDGGWKIVSADGAQLYALQIVDKAGGYGDLEGAWRDVRRPGTVGSTGLIDDVRHDGPDVIARFSPKEGQASVLTLRPADGTRWSGQLVENGQTQTVTAEHLLPQAPAGYETDRRGPYVWPVAQRAAVSRPEPAAPTCSTKGKKGKALKAAKAKCAVAAKKGKASTLKKGKGGKASKATAAKKGKATAAKKTTSKSKKKR